MLLGGGVNPACSKGFTHVVIKENRMKNKTFTQKSAFTLAEVLITLGIIGVVAALTLPTLTKNYQKRQTVIQVKKTYSLLNNALEMAKKDYDTDINNWEIIHEGSLYIRSEHFAKNYLIPYLSVVEECGKSSESGCNYNSNLLSGGSYSFILKNGNVVRLAAYYNDASQSADITRIEIIFDINGKKGPNVLGKDIFEIELGGGSSYKQLNKFLPYGYISSSSCDRYYDMGISRQACTADGYKGYCLAAIMCNGWKIPDNYPW
jgi:prepilin-type N-terminal cleavage/methylation domain-containing protein